MAYYLPNKKLTVVSASGPIARLSTKEQLEEISKTMRKVIIAENPTIEGDNKKHNQQMLDSLQKLKENILKKQAEESQVQEQQDKKTKKLS